MSFWLPPSARWSLGPGVRRENDEINRRQIRTFSRFSGSSVLFLRFSPPPLSFPPRKRGPRSRGGVAVMERTSAQRVFRRHDVRVVLKRKHALCRGSHDGSMSSWLPPNARWRSEEHTSELQSRGHVVCRL